MITRHGVFTSSFEFRTPDEVLGIDYRVTDEACATNHADEFFFRKSIPLLARHLRIIDLDSISRFHGFCLSCLLGSY